MSSRSCEARMDHLESLEGWLACHHCDALLHLSHLSPGRSMVCPHCGNVLLQRKKRPMERTLAFSLAGLLFYIPANFLPIMSLEILGSDATNTMIKGVVQLWHQGYLWMATLVFLCSIALPLLELVVLFLLSWAAVNRRFHAWHRPLLRSVHSISEWGMLEVYMLGILVAFIKLSDLGATQVDIALFCFVGLLVSSLGAAVSFDAHRCWHLLEHARHVRAR